MPASKPSSLKTRHDSKKDRATEESTESTLNPKTQLSLKPPAALRGHKTASEIWTRTVSLYFETEGTIITAFDQDVLIKYCLAEEELVELFELRKQIKKLWDRHCKILDKMNVKADDLKAYYSALSEANALLQRFQGMDARMDGKRKFVFGLAQSLYLTPRSRAGVAPSEKPEEPEPDPMDQLLDGKKSK